MVGERGGGAKQGVGGGTVVIRAPGCSLSSNPDIPQKA